MNVFGNPAYASKDQRDMSDWFRKQFVDEVEAGGFVQGAKSFIVVGHNVEEDCLIAVACLSRGQYDVFALNPLEIYKRLQGQYVPRNDDDVKQAFDRAECYFIFDLFEPEIIDALSTAQIGEITWFLRQSLMEGICLVFVTKNLDPDLNILGEGFGELLERELEAISESGSIHGTATESKRKNRKHRRSTTTGKSD